MASLLLVLAITALGAAVPVYENDPGTIREKRGAAKLSAALWNPALAIPVTFDSAINTNMLANARAAMAEISASTCISFTEESNTPNPYSLKFNLIGRRSPCNSMVGRPQYSDEGVVNIGKQCEEPASIAHELFHALGLEHTTSRADRDEFVSVRAGYEGEYFKLPKELNNNFGVPFDYGSIMTYGAYILSKDGNPVVVPKDIGYLKTLGSLSYIKFNDFLLINRLYNCSSTCSSGVTCENGGFLNSRDCSSCICPKFYDGARCENIKEEIILTAEAPSRTFGIVNKHNKSVDNWDWAKFGKEGPMLIRAPEGKRVEVRFNNIDFWDGKDMEYWECSDRFPCTHMGVEINDDGDDLTVTGKQFCCPNTDNGKTIVSKKNVLGYMSWAKFGFAFTSNITVSIVD